MLLHVPPLVASDSVIFEPGQTTDGPVIAATVLQGGVQRNICPLAGNTVVFCEQVLVLAVPAVVAAQLLVVVLLL
jgi:hypothetical protein